MKTFRVYLSGGQVMEVCAESFNVTFGGPNGECTAYSIQGVFNSPGISPLAILAVEQAV